MLPVRRSTVTLCFVISSNLFTSTNKKYTLRISFQFARGKLHALTCQRTGVDRQAWKEPVGYWYNSYEHERGKKVTQLVTEP